ncbi:MAG: hypothetical protein HFI34_11885 [Lachnospiraceae bacterium]|nr:hypothetical protein [Lachnospiraceae bacterium]
MKKAFRKIISMACITVMTVSLATVDASALTRRLYGDVNNDGIIDNKDVELIQEYLVDLVELDKYQLIAADVDKDGEVSIMDATLIQKLIEGLIDELPSGNAFLY